MTILYQNSRRLRVRSLQMVLWTLAVGLIGWQLAEQKAGTPDAGLLLAIFTPLFALLILGIEIYIRGYVINLTETPAGLEIITLSTLGRRSKLIDWKDVEIGRELHDLFVSGAVPTVDNRARLLHLSGRRLPLIVDTTRDGLDIRTLKKRCRSKH